MRNIIFADDQHKAFYEDKMGQLKGSYDNCYIDSILYTLAVSPVTRSHFDELFNMRERAILPDGLIKPWQTGSSKKVTRLAFNLFNGLSEEVEHSDNEEGYSFGDYPSGYYAVDQIFCCSYAPYFFQAIKLRYPEYTGE